MYHRFEFEREYEGYTLTGTVVSEKDGSDYHVEEVFINGSDNDAYGLLAPGVIAWLEYSLYSEVQERIEDLKVESRSLNVY